MKVLLTAAALLLALAIFRLVQMRRLSGGARERSAGQLAGSPATLEPVGGDLQEIELDYAMGKLSDEDYRALIAQHSWAAERGSAPPVKSGASSTAHDNEGSLPGAELQFEAEELVGRYRSAQVSCPECGPRPEPQAIYCSNCGRYLGACPACGAAVDAVLARFCPKCGALLSTPTVPTAGGPAAKG